MRLVRDQRGEVSLTELLVACAVMLFVCGAALTSLDTFGRVDRTSNERLASQDEARTALDRLSRELRNLASPTPEQPQAVDRATPFDVIFQTVDPNGPNSGSNTSNVRRVRWCLPATGTTLYAQTQTWTTGTPPATPTTTVCGPAATGGWQTSRAVARDVVNRRGGQERPLFAFDSTVLTDIAAVHAELFVDHDPGRGAAETRLSSGVFLRNQNRRPEARFTATPTAQGLLLNGSLSSDPEGQELLYEWWQGGVRRGAGVVFTLPDPGTGAVTLVVRDPAGLVDSQEGPTA